MVEDKKNIEILLLEDDPITAKIMAHHLSQYQVHSVNNLSAAKNIELIRKCQVVVTDFVLPDGNALGFLEFIKEIELAKPVIVMTKFSNTQIMSNCWKAGAFDFLEKPVSKSQILECVDVAIHFTPPYTRYTALSKTVVAPPEKRFVDLELLFKTLDEDLDLFLAVLQESHAEMEKCCGYIKTLYLCNDPKNANESLQFHLHRLEGVAKNLFADVLLEVVYDITLAVGRGEQIVESDMEYLIKTAEKVCRHISSYVKTQHDKNLSK